MKFTLSWLKDYLQTEASLEQICAKLTDIGLEVEQVLDKSKQLHNFKVAHIIKTQPHPEAEKLQICSVDNGKEILQIICGAANARTGLKVVLAPIGVVIPNGDFKIKAAKIRNIESFGMLCSMAELNLSEESEGIIELNNEAVIGDSCAKYLGVDDDPVIEVSITPNRADCLGIYGIARDLAASGIGILKELNLPIIKGEYNSKIKTAVNTKSCTKFISFYIQNVQNKQSPDWLKTRLEAIGQKSISAIVDITNYINLSYNRPLHAYDADKIENSITIRMAKESESFEALNDKQYSLSQHDMVIADDKKILALAGIIGAQNSAVSLSSCNILLEAAQFNNIVIAKSGRNLKINSDSRFRFERHVDSEFCQTGAELAVQLITEICGGKISRIEQTITEKPTATTIDFDVGKIKTLGGVTIDIEETRSILTKLGCQVSTDFQVKVPSWRADIRGSADLVEEVLRIKGFDYITSTLLPRSSLLCEQAISSANSRINSVRRMLTTRGLDEVISWSFMSANKAEQFSSHNSDLLIKNPIHVDLNYMRPTIIANLLEIIKKNKARHFNNLNLFEIGPVFSGTEPDEQSKIVTIVRSGKTQERSIHKDERYFDIFDVKADVIAILTEMALDFSKLTLDFERVPQYYHPKRSAILRLGKTIIGYFGELHPALVKKFDLDLNVIAGEIIFDNLPQIKNKQGKKAAYIVSDFQSVNRDFAFVIDRKVNVENLIKAVRSVDKKLIQAVELFDVYQGSNIDCEKKSVAISVTMQSIDRTLTDAQIDKISNDIVVSVAKIGAILRN